MAASGTPASATGSSKATEQSDLNAASAGPAMIRASVVVGYRKPRTVMSFGASGRYPPASATRVPADWAAAGVTRGIGMRAALAAAMTINDRHGRQRLLSLIGEL